MNKIPSRGPVIVNLKNGFTLDLWYDSSAGVRSWVLQHKDAEGNQIGPGCDGEASYSHRREDAVKEMQSIMEKDAQ